METHLVDLPFPFRFSCIPPRKRTRRDYTAFDVGVFEVPVLDAHEAPVTLTWAGRDVRTIEGCAFLATGTDLARFVGERLRPGSAGLWGHVAYRFPAAQALVVRYGFVPDRLVKDLRSTLDDVRTGADMPDVLRRRATGQVRDLVLERERGLSEAARAWRRTLAVVDGQAWVSTYAYEPHFAVFAPRRRRRAGLDVSVDPWDGETVLCRYPADRLDEAMAHPSVRADRAPPPGGYPRVRGELSFDPAVGLASVLVSLLSPPLMRCPAQDPPSVAPARLDVLARIAAVGWLDRDRDWAVGFAAAAARYLDACVGIPDCDLDAASRKRHARAALASAPVEVDDTEWLADMA